MATTVPEKRHLSTEDACRIIDSSAKAGVSELTFGSLHVKFGKPTEIRLEDVLNSTYPFVKQTAAPTATVNDLTEEQHKQLAKDSLQDDEVRLREDRLRQALVEDPALYEELLRQGDLSDDVDDADSDDDI